MVDILRVLLAVAAISFAAPYAEEALRSVPGTIGAPGHRGRNHRTEALFTFSTWRPSSRRHLLDGNPKYRV